MSFGKIFWGLMFILSAVLLCLNATGVIAPLESSVGEINIAFVILSVFLVALIIWRISKLRFNEIFIPLSLIFMMFEKNIAFVLGREENLINNWILLLCAVLLTIGFSFFMPRKRIKVRTKKKIKVVKGDKKSCKMGEHAVAIDCDAFKEKNIENIFGECKISFANEEKYAGGATLEVDNKFGATIVEVPVSWQVVCNVENSMGEVSVAGNGSEGGPVLNIVGYNKFGAVYVRFV